MLGVKDKLKFRRFDLPPTTPIPGDDHGRMVCDCVLGSDGASWQLFSYPGDSDKLDFDAVRGDGGQVLVASESGILAVCTTDSGTPMQYFNGAACPGGTGWIIASANLGPKWNQTVAILNDEASDPGDCSGLNPAFTRWRTMPLTWPFTLDGTAMPLNVPTLISEHYNGATLASPSMERQFHGLGWGLLRWEAWGSGADVSGSGYAPDVGAPAVAAPLVLVACRTWTRIVTQKKPFTAAEFGWPSEKGWPL